MNPIILLIFAIAVEYNVPSEFALSIALQKNDTLSPTAISQPNANGSRDRGVMQLNDRHFDSIDWQCPEENIRAGVQHIRWLMERPEIQTFWDVAVAYNAGLGIINNPPASTIEYANQVMWRWDEMSKGNIQTVIWKN